MKVKNVSSVTDKVGERFIEEVMANKIRSRPIYFKAEGLRPNSKHFAFFDGVSVAAWVKEEAFVRHATNSTDYGDKWRTLTGHPNTAGTLESDANGIIEGSFWIPNTTAISFDTGSAIDFKLLDVSVDNEKEATSRARALYSAKGTLATYSPEYKTTRTLQITQIEMTPPIDVDPVITTTTTTNNTSTGNDFVPTGTSGGAGFWEVDTAGWEPQFDVNNGSKVTKTWPQKPGR